MARRYMPPNIHRRSDTFLSFFMSVLFHGAIVAALVSGWFVFKSPSVPEPTLAIDAVPVDARSLGTLRQPPPEPPPPQPEPQGPPEPTPQELAQREQALKEQAEKEQQQAEAERQRQEQQRAAEEQVVRERQAEEQRQVQERAETERKAREAAEAERKAHEVAEAQKKAEQQKRAEEQKRAEQQRKAEEQKRLAEQKRQQDEKEKADREAEVKRSIAQDEEEQRATAARTSAEVAGWTAAIKARISRAWIRPPSAQQGIQCLLHVTQEPGGQVSNVSIGSCNGDQAVRESISAAVYRASPLPPPPDPSLFERNLTINFAPDGSSQQ